MAADPENDDALSARLDRLKGDLKAAASKPTPAPRSAPATGASTGAAWSLAMRAGSEFVAAIIVGGAIGWGLDWLLHTKPALTIVFFLLGVAAGVWNVIRATSPKGGA
jgi:ATP synthase protein I